MALATKAQNKLEKEVEVLTENWVAINRKRDATEWQAWINWRHREMNSNIAPDDLTVPTSFPPSTINAVKEYFAAITTIRKCNGWRGSEALLSSSPSAWMGEI